MHNDLFSIGPFTIHGYGLMIFLGVISACFIAVKRARKLGLNSEILDSLIVWILVGGIAGAKILFWLTQLEAILNNPKLMLDFNNGFVVYGGIMGGVVCGFLFCRLKKLDFLTYFDLLMPSVALAQGFGRIGCFLAGCCYGIESNHALSVVFPAGSFAPSGIHLAPIQLIASALNFLLFAILIFCSHRKKQKGQVAALYLILNSIGRFILEYFRGDLDRGKVGFLSTSQFIAIFIFFVGFLFLYILNQKKKDK